MAPGASTLRLCLRASVRHQSIRSPATRQLLVIRAAGRSSRRCLHATASRSTDNDGKGSESSNNKPASTRAHEPPEIENIRRKFDRFRAERKRDEKPLVGLPLAAVEDMEKDMVRRARLWPIMNYDPDSDPDQAATRRRFASELKDLGEKFDEADLDRLLEGDIKATPQYKRAFENTGGHGAGSNDMIRTDPLASDRPPPSPASLTYAEIRTELTNLVDGDPDDPTTPAEPRPLRSNYWFDEDDDDPQTHDVEGWDTFNEDDITTVAHGKLDELREHRHYMRLAAWEMPLLSKLAKPFEPPSNEHVLRFRYTTYLGEFHPAARKVVVQFSPADLGLTPAQELKMKKLAGPRYNPDKDFIKMSCESFDHQAQNKRYLSDQVDRLIAATKDPTDMFEDIPLDLRHHRPKKRAPKFPDEWIMTPERAKELEKFREAEALKDQEKETDAALVDGKKVIHGFLGPPLAYETEIYAPQMAKKYVRKRVDK